MCSFNAEIAELGTITCSVLEGIGREHSVTHELHCLQSILDPALPVGLEPESWTKFSFFSAHANMDISTWGLG